ncbi:MAG: metal ABC transporter permease [Puniceicoccaceae bacterium]
MEWLMLDTWIVIVGGLCAAACAVPGVYLLLRGMSMMGDAISHAVLPGLAIGFLVSGSRTSSAMFLGAAAVGVLTAVFTQWVSKRGKLEQGASMGVVFTTLFAVGLLLMVQTADKVDLDANCVLYGAIEMVPLDIGWEMQVMGGTLEVPRAVLVLLVILAINLTLVLVFYKEFKIGSFDPDFAEALSMHPSRIHYLLMIMVAVTTVASFEVVGSIIVIAMLIVPAATAYLLTDRLAMMLILAPMVGFGSAFSGHLMAITIPPWFGFIDTSSAGMMAVATGIFFLAAWLWSPQGGLLRRQRLKAPEVMTTP